MAGREAAVCILKKLIRVYVSNAEKQYITSTTSSQPFIHNVFTLFTAQFEHFIEPINQMLVCCFIR